MKYLRKFNSHSSYVSPNVSAEHRWDVTWCRQEKEVHYKAYHDYSQDYFTLVALEDNCEFSIMFDRNLQNNVNSVSYSLDNGQTWTTLDISTGNYNNETVVLGTVNINQKILVKGDAICYAPNRCTTFSADKFYIVEGNIMSLLYDDQFKNQASLPSSEYCFYELFWNSTELLSAKNLILPAEQLEPGCYNMMFNGCTNLNIAPKLPATTLAQGCYQGMFEDCTNLTKAPELPATTLEESCYEDMFKGCTNLTKAPELPAPILVSRCYYCMFQSCSALNYIKCLAEDTTASQCLYWWVKSVAATGTFVKKSIAEWTTGVSGIPTGWVVEDIRVIPEEFKDNPYYYQYLTIESLEDGNSISGSKYFGGNVVIQYSVDNGNIWTDYTYNSGSMATLNTGDKILLRGSNNYYGYSSVYNAYIVTSKTVNVYGNIASLRFNDMFVGASTVLSTDTALAGIFYNSKVVSAENLVLPFLKLTGEYAYAYMFSYCQNLVTPPSLPATVLSEDCYYSMFERCSSLVTPPELPATTLAANCYYFMFRECSNLTTSPTLPATTLAYGCYERMFEGTKAIPDCSHIDFTSSTVVNSGGLHYLFSGTKVTDNDLMNILPKNNNNKYYLPVTRLTRDCCYSGLFQYCTSLTTAPELPATTLATQCYSGMFKGCTSLTTAPSILPATTLTSYCYNQMFYGCTSLTSAPLLSATTLANSCYGEMFRGCTSLTTAPTLPVTTLAERCYSYMFFGCTNLTTAPTLPATTLANGCYSNMLNGCTSLLQTPSLPATTLVQGCYYGMFYGTDLIPDCTNIDFTDSTVASSGGLRGLFAGTKVTDAILRTILPINPTTNNYYLPNPTDCEAMFKDCTLLVTAPDLPAITLTGTSYMAMFRGCTNLVNIPETLPATTLIGSCYREMFYNCKKITTAPVLPAITLSSQCYEQMFYYCSSLNYIKAMFTTTPSTSYTRDWVYGVSSSGTFVKNSAAEWNVNGTNGIPNGWTKQTASE